MRSLYRRGTYPGPNRKRLGEIKIPKNTSSKKKTAPEAPVPTEKVPTLARVRVTLRPDTVLRVVSSETRSAASLDLIRAIGELGSEASLAKVLALSAGRFTAPRSAEAKKDPEGFLRGYVTFLVREGLVAVA